MSVSADPRIGSELLGYRIERVLGRGGMGVVPTLGHIRLDERRQAIAPNYLIRYQQDGRGKLTSKAIRKVKNVEQTFNGYFRPGDPPPGEDTIKCKKGNPPPWTRR